MENLDMDIMDTKKRYKEKMSPLVPLIMYVFGQPHLLTVASLGPFFLALVDMMGNSIEVTTFGGIAAVSVYLVYNDMIHFPILHTFYVMTFISTIMYYSRISYKSIDVAIHIDVIDSSINYLLC